MSSMVRIAGSGLPVAALIVGLGAVACDGPEEIGASLSVAETLAGSDTAGYARAVEPRDFSFPADHGPHLSFRHEWWYFTGNVAATGANAGEGGDFGFQLTIFRNALRPDRSETVPSPWAARQAYMGHFALTDVAARTFHAFERFDRGAVGLAGSQRGPVRVWVGDWEIEHRGPGSGFVVRAEEEGVGVDLTLTPLKPVVLQGDRGLSQKGPEPGNASYYYSFTRLRAEGTVTADGVERPVTGEAWLDREWSTSALSPGLVGWDWFSIQLGDGSELMVYRLREEDGGTGAFSAGTFVDSAGEATRLEADAFVLEPLGQWTSPEGGTYPSGWRVRVPSLALDLTVTPRLVDQELDLAFRYGEGAVGVAGRREGRALEGRGYVELTGYAEEGG